jgi:hypothetical protein
MALTEQQGQQACERFMSQWGPGDDEDDEAYIEEWDLPYQDDLRDC